MALIKLNNQSLSAVTSAGLPSGTVLQVQSALKTDTFSSTSQCPSFVDVTGLSVSITPISTSSKILVLANIALGYTLNNFAFYRILRGASTVVGEADAFGNRTPVAAVGYDTNEGHFEKISATYLDSPATSSQITYKIQVATGSSSYAMYINRSYRNTDSAANDPITSSSIIVMEIAG